MSTRLGTVATIAAIALAIVSAFTPSYAQNGLPKDADTWVKVAAVLEKAGAASVAAVAIACFFFAFLKERKGYEARQQRFVDALAGVSASQTGLTAAMGQLSETIRDRRETVAREMEHLADEVRAADDRASADHDRILADLGKIAHDTANILQGQVTTREKLRDIRDVEGIQNDHLRAIRARLRIAEEPS